MEKNRKWQQIVFMNLMQWYFNTLFSADVGDWILIAVFLLVLPDMVLPNLALSGMEPPFSKGLLHVSRKQ